MEIEINPASADALELMTAWRYPPPYDGDADPVLNPERFYEARDDAGELVGFYYFEPNPPWPTRARSSTSYGLPSSEGAATAAGP